jgi:transcriptional regulator with AAA-type ATPase domain
METLTLYFRDEPLREYTLADRPLEVGSAGYCDIVINDPRVADRALLLEPKGGTVVAYDLRRGRGGGPSPVPLEHPILLGLHHRLVRSARPPRVPTASTSDGPTERLGVLESDPSPLHLVVGRGAEARRRRLGARPITVGSGPACDLVLADRAVSALHCRFELGRGGVVLRDLGSRNGTWVGGLSVKTALVVPGSLVRVGRTDLRLVRELDAADADASGLVFCSAEMQELLAETERVARFDWPVLVTGESGAGKEGIARRLHERSRRASGPFVAVNAGSFSAQLVESELFGHEKGAFTGAVGVHRGAFEQAEGGTLFLDEIGELPLSLQARLLRVLDGWEVRRVGGEAAIAVDVRLVCATHRDLSAMVREGTFREDLYYRIRQEALRVPPLRERPADVPALAAHFLRGVEPQVGARSLSEGGLARLLAHPWPGNVRELRNVVRAAAVRSASARLEAEDVEAALERLGSPREAGRSDERGIAEVLERHRGNAAAAARALGIPRSTLRDRLRKLEGRKLSE